MSKRQAVSQPQPMNEDAVSFIIARMYTRKSAEEIVFYGDRAKLSRAQAEYEAGARCFMKQSSLALCPRIKREPVKLKLSLLSRVKRAFA